ncbi:iron-containing redox enzyme family protein [Archangium sp. Cb G35]|uniref:iron-containing redox enzyme family protein n=1 Tax=Archangium sp. Cb G35 TaxID=1920190 RepID=UPI000B287FE4|nr:iron-containing redox enzyme family protein [Archangium sp. Cb G35]
MWIRSGFREALSPGVRALMADAHVAFANLETPVDPARPVPRLVYETLHYNAPPGYLDAWEGTARHRVFSLCGIPAERQLSFLGALYVLEGVARHLGGDTRQGLGRLGLDRTRARFLLVHLDVDVEHGARAQALCESLGAHGPEPLLDGARQAADFWVAIHRRALAEA